MIMSRLSPARSGKGAPPWLRNWELELPGALAQERRQHRAHLHGSGVEVRVLQLEREAVEVRRQPRRAATRDGIDVALADAVVVRHQPPFRDGIARSDVVDVAGIAGGRGDHEDALVADVGGDPF
jgi:hypothetical protein